LTTFLFLCFHTRLSISLYLYHNAFFKKNYSYYNESKIHEQNKSFLIDRFQFKYQMCNRRLLSQKVGLFLRLNYVDSGNLDSGFIVKRKIPLLFLATQRNARWIMHTDRNLKWHKQSLFNCEIDDYSVHSKLKCSAKVTIFYQTFNYGQLSLNRHQFSLFEINKLVRLKKQLDFLSWKIVKFLVCKFISLRYLIKKVQNLHSDGRFHQFYAHFFVLVWTFKIF